MLNVWERKQFWQSLFIWQAESEWEQVFQNLALHQTDFTW